jgi:hypothetical protein
MPTATSHHLYAHRTTVALDGKQANVCQAAASHGPARY